ncbi:unnamed protein product [Thelazia callipaeda]|uniref:Wiskott-Aldrich syndrome protein family member n=1 Tax=Thelazia callipaeda TaxID=103827 RepID=A0A0N5D3K4_THECL|nr:unnamed protein product [Thelazia callipaeda]
MWVKFGISEHGRNLWIPSGWGRIYLVVFCLDAPGETMMTWLPPSPPLSDSGDDIYYDCTGEYWFEQLPMAEHRLPSIIYELYRPLPAAPRLPPAPRCMPEIVLPGPIQYQIAPGVLPPIIAMPPSPTGMCTVASGIIRDTVPSPSTSVTSIAQERGINLIPQTGASSGAAYLDTSNLLRPATPSCLPGSVDDTIDSVRKTAQKTIPFQGLQRSQVGSRHCSLLDGRNTTSDLRRPFTPPPRYREAIDYDGTEWSIAEEYEALMILTKLQRLPNHLHSTKDGHCVNWDLMSTLLSTWSEVYRYVVIKFFSSPRQCSLHYQMVVQPREEGRMVTLDPITKKTRRVPLSSSEMITNLTLIKLIFFLGFTSRFSVHMKRGRTKTDQQYFADIVQLLSSEFDKKAKALKMASLKQTPHLEMQRLDEAEIKWDLPEAQGMKLTELGVQYDSTTTLLEIINRREENRKNSVKSTTQKNLTFIGDDEETVGFGQITEEKATLKEPALSTIPGVINYQRISYDDIMQEAQKQPVAVATSLSGTSVSTAKIFSASSQSQSASSASAQSSSDSTPIIFGQRACADHSQSPKLQVTSAATPTATTSATSSATPAAHQISSRRLTVPVGSGSSAQHQIVMTGSTQMGSTGGQQPYAVVVTSHDTVSHGLQFAWHTLSVPNAILSWVVNSLVDASNMRYDRKEWLSGKRFIEQFLLSVRKERYLHKFRNDGGKSDLLYFTAFLFNYFVLKIFYFQQKVFQIATGTSAESQQQIYAAPSHSGRTLIMSQGDNSHLGEASQIQMIRPQMQTGISLRQDVRPKIAQRTPQGRLYVTTTGADRTYIMPQSQVRMIHGAQRITSKRVTNSLHTKTIGGQAQVGLLE